MHMFNKERNEKLFSKRIVQNLLSQQHVRVSITLKCVIASLVVLAIILVYYYLNMDLICISLITDEIKCLFCMFVGHLYIIICECIMKINLLYYLLEIYCFFFHIYTYSLPGSDFCLWCRSDFFCFSLYEYPVVSALLLKTSCSTLSLLS